MTVRLDPRGKWTVDFVWRYADGRRLRVRKDAPNNTKQSAQEYERRLKNAIEQGTYGTNTKEAPLFKTYAEEYMRMHAKPNNKPSSYDSKESMLRNHLLPFLGNKRLDTIKPKTVDGLKALLIETKRTPKTANNVLTMLGHMLYMAVEWEYLTSAPRIKKLKVKETQLDYYTPQEIGLILQALNNSTLSSLVILAINTGLRLGELRALKWSDVDFDGARLVVRSSLYKDIEGTPKGHKAAEVPLNAVVIKTLRAHKATNASSGIASVYVFCDTKGKALTRQKIAKAIRRACIKAKVPHARCCHKLRHTFGSQLAMGNVPLKTVQELLRHTDIKTTMRYAHCSPAYRVSAVDQLAAVYGDLDVSMASQTPVPIKKDQ